MIGSDSLVSRSARTRSVMLAAALFATLGLLGAVGTSPASALACTDASLFNMPPANAPLPGSCFEGYDGNQVDPDGPTPALPTPPNRLDWQSAIGTSGYVPAPDYVVGSNDSQFGPGGDEEVPDDWTFNVGSLGSDKYDAVAAWTFREPNTDRPVPRALVRPRVEQRRDARRLRAQPEAAGLSLGAGDRYGRAHDQGADAQRRRPPDHVLDQQQQQPAPRIGLCKWSGTSTPATGRTSPASTSATSARRCCRPCRRPRRTARTSPAPNNFLQPGTRARAGQFGEAAINLTEALKAAGGNPNQPDPCVSFGYMWMHSRSAPSITSNQQDYILPTDAINVANCAVTGTKFHDLDGDRCPRRRRARPGRLDDLRRLRQRRHAGQQQGRPVRQRQRRRRSRRARRSPTTSRLQSTATTCVPSAPTRSRTSRTARGTSARSARRTGTARSRPPASTRS